MKLTNFVLIIFLVFGLLSIPSSVFAVDNNVASSGSFLDISSNVFVVGFVPVLKGGVSVDDIQEFMNLPTEDKIFVILAGLAIIIFVIWYSFKGKYMKLSRRIPIIIVMLLLIFVPLYLLGNMIYFVVAVLVTIIILGTTWYQEHGRHMSLTGLIGAVIGVCLLMGLVAGVPGYYYFTAAEDITDVTVTSTNASLEIVDYKVYRNTFSDSDIKFEGYVKNNGKTSAEYVQINATGYDVAGNVVANDTTYVDDNTLLPGSTSPFGELSSYYGGYLEDPQRKIVRVKLEVITT